MRILQGWLQVFSMKEGGSIASLYHCLCFGLYPHIKHSFMSQFVLSFFFFFFSGEFPSNGIQEALEMV